MPDLSTTSPDPDPERGPPGRGVGADGLPARVERAPARPDFAYMRPRLSRWIAFGLGSGLSGVAPGTAGTLWAWAAWALVGSTLSATTAALLVVPAFLLGVWACGRAAEDLGVADHGAIDWDEIVAFWLVLCFTPAGFGAQFAAFLLFRFFDIAKPPPIGHFDRTVSGGFGIMLDDLLAAFATLLLMAAWHAWA